MDILNRIDFVQQFAKEYADGVWSVEAEKWKHHVTPEFIEDVRQYIVSLQQKLMHMQTTQAKDAVAWRVWNGGLQDDGNIYVYSEDGDGEPLYTTPPKREWVGLTDAEMNDITCGMVKGWVMEQLAQAIEAKLKEKNT